MVDFRRLEDINVAGKRVLVRVDFNVPCDDDGNVTDDTRLQAAHPTINYLRDRKAIVILISHFGRPGGRRETSASMMKLVGPLSKLLGADIAFAPDCIGITAEKAVAVLAAGNVLLLENTRFHKGETHTADGTKGYDPKFASALAAHGEIFVHDAFSVAHRAQGSTSGIAASLPAYAGLAMERELDHLSQALDIPQRPVMALVGGAKQFVVQDAQETIKSSAVRSASLTP